jgi:hypothetical protein
MAPKEMEVAHASSDAPCIEAAAQCLALAASGRLHCLFLVMGENASGNSDSGQRGNKRKDHQTHRFFSF